MKELYVSYSDSSQKPSTIIHHAKQKTNPHFRIAGMTGD